MTELTFIVLFLLALALFCVTILAFGLARELKRFQPSHAQMQAIERRIADFAKHVDELLYASEGPNPAGIASRLRRERDEARAERDKAEAEVNRLMLLVHAGKTKEIAE